MKRVARARITAPIVEDGAAHEVGLAAPVLAVVCAPGSTSHKSCATLARLPRSDCAKLGAVASYPRSLELAVAARVAVVVAQAEAVVVVVVLVAVVAVVVVVLVAVVAVAVAAGVVAVVGDRPE